MSFSDYANYKLAFKYWLAYRHGNTYSIEGFYQKILDSQLVDHVTKNGNLYLRPKTNKTKELSKLLKTLQRER